MFENDGSNALKQEALPLVEPFAEPELSPERDVERAADRAAKRKKQRMAAEKAKKRQLTAQRKGAIVMAAVAVFSMALVVLMFKAELNTEYRNLSFKKDELSGLSSRVEQLSSEIEGGGSLVAIEEKAAEMGLYQADDSQLVYISLGLTDSGEVLAEDSGTGGLNLFLNKVAAVAEYLY